MLPKWKLILTNWINCYFNNTNKKHVSVSVETLLDILSHLRENYSLDEYKSSLRDAHTVQEFIVETYSDFKFDNGTSECDSEEDVHLAATLLLFFVCVNSKNTDLKNAMCSKLSPGDQEIILKFSKHLMECSKITKLEVQEAIAEACGQDIAGALPTNILLSATETPPALRSFHSEVRRLQAALDAERFDRTYLQEELIRTNTKVKKLLQDKEQYKLEIVNLKSQISLCCGEERESHGEDVQNAKVKQLMQQLKEMEKEFVRAQAQLEKVQDEREAYETKFNQLRSEHEKVVLLSLEESAKSNRLAEELEAQRKQTQSLQDLVAELRQHNQFNRMDSSLLECDDPDISIQFLQHNSSAELGANVIEVQLGEERAKIVVLKQQVELLQEQLCEFTKKAEKEKESLIENISKKENIITTLKQRVNEEIEEKNTLKTIFNDDIAKLNNEINELEQRLKGSQENSRHIIEKKMQEIQNLQEEKLSLLQSLSDETTKLENIIKDLQYEIDAEKSSKIRLRDEYDSHIMKLNEKVLNRNNELVELQNKILEKGETIETIQLELRKEKELRDQLSNKHNNDLLHLISVREQVEQDLKKKTEEARDLHVHLQKHITFIEQMNNDNEHLKGTILQLQCDFDLLNDMKEKLLVEIKNRDVKAEQIYKETENLKNLLCEEKQKLQYNLEETNATVSTLQQQLKNEIQFKMEMQNKLQESLDKNSSLSEKNIQLNADVQKLSLERDEKLSLINELNTNLTEEKKINALLTQDLTEVNSKLGILTQEVNENNDIIKDLKNELENDKKDFHESLLLKDKHIKSIEIKLDSEISEKNSLNGRLTSLDKENNTLLGILGEKENTILQMQSEYKLLTEAAEAYKITIESLQLRLSEISEENAQITSNHNIEITNLAKRLDDTEKSLKDVTANFNNVIEAKELLIQSLNEKAEQMERTTREVQESLNKFEAEKHNFMQQISTEKLLRNNIEKEYLNKCSTMNNVNAQLNEEIHNKDEEISSLKENHKKLLDTVVEKKEEIKLLEWNLTQTSQNLKDTTQQRDKEIEMLHKNMMKIERSTKTDIEELEKEILVRKHDITILETENSGLHHTIAKNDSLIMDLQKKIETLGNLSDTSNTYFEKERAAWENIKFDMETHITSKDDTIQDLRSQIDELNKIIEVLNQNEALTNEKEILIQELLEERTIRKVLDEEKQCLLYEKNRIEELLDKETAFRAQLMQEKECITQQLVEERLGKQLAEKETENMTMIKDGLQVELANAMALTAEVKKQNSSLLANIENLNQLIKNEELIQKEITVEKLKILEEYKVLEETKSRILNDNEVLNFKVLKLEAQIKTSEAKFDHDLSAQIKNKYDLDRQITTLIEEKEKLRTQISDESTTKSLLKKETDKLLKVNDNLSLEKGCLLIQNKTARHDLEHFKEQVKKLTNEKDVLNNKYDKLLESNEKCLEDLRDKQDEFQDMLSEYMSLKSEFKKLEERKVEIESALDWGIQYISDVVKKEDLSCAENCRLLETEKTEEIKLQKKCELFTTLISLLMTELIAKKDLQKKTQQENISLREDIMHKELQIVNHQTEIQSSANLIEQLKIDYAKHQEQCNTLLNLKNRDKETLQHENQTLQSRLNDVKVELDCKVHSLKDKLIDNENLTEKLKKTYDCQIDNLNMMVNKLTCYLKDKSEELDSIRKEKEKLQHIVDDNTLLITSLNDEIKSIKHDQEKLLGDFESERLVLKNMITVTESVMEDQRISLNKAISEHLKNIEVLQDENKSLKIIIENEKQNAEIAIKNKEYAIQNALKELSELKKEKATLESYTSSQIKVFTEEVSKLKEGNKTKSEQIEKLTIDNQELNNVLIKYKNDIVTLEEKNNEWKIIKDAIEVESSDKILNLKKELINKSDDYKKLECLLQENQAVIKTLNDRIADLDNQNAYLEFEKNELNTKVEEMKIKLEVSAEMENDLAKLKQDNHNLLELLEVQKSEIIKLESMLMYEEQQSKLLQDDNNNEKQDLTNKCKVLQEYQFKAEQELERRQNEIEILTAEIKQVTESSDKQLSDRDMMINQTRQEKDALITKLRKESDEREKLKKELESRANEVKNLTQKLEDVTRSETDTVKLLKKENEILKKTIALKESFAVTSQEKSSCKSAVRDVGVRDLHQQVDTTPTELTQSFESLKTISDLEKILQDKNRTIRSLQSDITDLKSLIAESENKLLDVSNDLEVSRENCQQLSSQLKKIVHQKNDEIADLKKQLTKMSATENRATQIIKVSAKYQSMILKRIAEIKSNTVLKELTNFGNTANCDSDLRRSLNAGTITMEDLENFLDTTDRHLKRFSEKQLVLQKERDRLAEVNKINESEIINMRKFLTELSVSIKTFNSVKELYTQKLSRVVSLQRTVRREILDLEGKVTDATMCKLERGYAAAMQDLSECAMNLERWVERIIGRAISTEKLKQAFSNEERTSVSPTTIQNASLEVQLEELENSFCKLLEEVARAQKGEGAKDAQAVTVMEVRAEYEDKLNRMKAKMKQLYQEQIGIFKEKQREEIVSLEQELQKAREKLEESSRAYEEHIRALTTELWSVGEKFLMKKDEAEWLRRKQRSGSLMSLQHVHSSGLMPVQVEPSRPSDTHSLRSLPAAASTNNKNEGRTLHMSDEEGEVFDNRCLRELASTPTPTTNPRATRDAPPGHRLSELQWRNSLCPPHLKSSYPAETQFVAAIHEEDIKCVGGPTMSLGGRSQRKEVGITAYKKPGPPTPSKQAGRLSATDSELRESLRVETEPNASRKTGTPSRIRALFRSAKGDNEGTPRSRRLSNIFRKK